jgi:hypothetical protein
MGRRAVYSKVQFENLKGRDHLGNLSVDGKIIAC